MAPKNGKLEKRSDHLQLSIFGRRIGPKLKKLQGVFFPGREYGELAIK